MTKGWHSRILYSEGPTGQASDRVIERDAVGSAISALYQLVLVRHAGDRPRVAAYLWGQGRGIGPSESTCLDLETGEEFVVSSTDPGWEAKRINVDDLPPDVRVAWPVDGKGKSLTPGMHESVSKPVVDQAALRRIAAQAVKNQAPGQLRLGLQ